MKHPAKYSDEIMPVIRQLLALTDTKTILDPFAGTGRIHELRPDYETTGVELEAEWADLSPHNIVGDALNLYWFEDGAFDAVVTSPAYGNRMADKDMRESVAGTYAKSLGRLASKGSSCHLQWGETYRLFHVLWLKEMRRVIRDDGWLIINVSDHVRGKVVQRVVEWFDTAARNEGFAQREQIEVVTKRLRRGANADSRVDTECVTLYRKV